jgi:hypothetical protein
MLFGLQVSETETILIYIPISRLAFTKAETTPEEDDKLKWQLLTPTTFRKISVSGTRVQFLYVADLYWCQSSQQTMLVGGKDQYNFTVGIRVIYSGQNSTNALYSPRRNYLMI